MHRMSWQQWAALTLLGIAVSNVAGCRTHGTPHVALSNEFASQSVERVAIVVRDSSGKLTSPTGTMQQVEDEFISGCLKAGYRVADRSATAIIVAEMKYQRSGFTDTDAVELGKVINVPAVMVVTITDAGTSSTDYGLRRNNQPVLTHYSNASLSARLISVGTGEALWVGMHSDFAEVGDPRSGGAAGVASAARALAATIPPRAIPTDAAGVAGSAERRP